MITEKSMRVFDVIHNNKNFKIIVDNSELTIVTETGVVYGKNVNNKKNFFALAPDTDILACMAKKNVFDLAKSKERTIYKMKVVATGMNLKEDVIRELEYRINRKKNIHLDDFIGFCVRDLTAFCPELIKQDIIDIAMKYPKVAVEAVEAFCMCVQPILAENIKKPYEKDTIVVDYYNKNGAELYPSTLAAKCAGLNERIQLMHNFYGLMYKSGELKKISFEYREYDDVVFFAFNANDLADFANANLDNPIVTTAISKIIFGGIAPCNMTGAIQPGAVMSTYRDNHGCVGRSHECTLIQQLDTYACGLIYDEKKCCGVEAAVKLAFSLSCFKK